MGLEQLKDLFERALIFLDSLPFPDPMERILAGFVVFSMLAYWSSRGIKFFKSRTGAGSAINRARVKSAGGRNLKKEAKQLQRAGKIAEAGDIWMRMEKYDHALKLYMKARDYGRAGDLYKKIGKIKDAVSMYEKGGRFYDTGKIHEKEKKFLPAAQAYEKASKYIEAADLYRRVQDYRSSAGCYEKARMFGKAGEMYLNAGDTLAAAKALESEFKGVAGRLKGHIDGTEADSIRKIARQAGGLYRKAGNLEQAVELFVVADCKDLAAEVYEELGDHEKAAKLFDDAGKHEHAARLYEKTGNEGSAAYLRAELEKSKGNLSEAAMYYVKADRNDIAADIYMEMGEDLKAAQLYMKSKDYSIAADIFVRHGKEREAAEAYEAGSSYEKAAELYEKQQDLAGAARVLMKRGLKVKAAKKFIAMGDYKSASTVIADIQDGDPDFKESQLVGASIMRQTGRNDQAIALLQKGLMGESISDDNVPSFYMLARLMEESGMPTPAMEIYKRILVTHYTYGDVAARLKALEKPSVGATVAGTQGGDGATYVATGSKGPPRPARYELLEEIGRGGMGVVYKARDTVLDREVAYKALPPDLKNYPKIVESFSREAKALAALRHPGIITVFDAGEENGEYYFVMEYVDGMDLKDYIQKRGMLPLKNAMRIIWDVCQALNYAHGKNIIHRDIKTSNVMLGRDKRILLMDFGLAKVMDEAKAQRTAVSGTPFYMSPEQTTGEGVDHRSDLYSLGVMAYELFSGTVPFKTGDIQYHHMHTAPTPLREVKSNIPEQVETIVMKLIQKDKALRYQSAAELLEDIKKIKL